MNLIKYGIGTLRKSGPVTPEILDSYLEDPVGLPPTGTESNQLCWRTLDDVVQHPDSLRPRATSTSHKPAHQAYALERNHKIHMHNEAIIAMEDRLRTAMLESDAPVLDMLLADELIFTNHLGQIMTKQNDLDAHRAGFVKIKSIDPSEQRIKSQGDLAIVSMLSRILGEFGGAPAEVPLRFTRIWQKTERGRWQVTAAHSCVVV